RGLMVALGAGLHGACAPVGTLNDGGEIPASEQSSDAGPTPTSAAAFPGGLALVSPLAGGQAASPQGANFAISGSGPTFDDVTETIAAVLDGGLSISAAFEPRSFLARPGRAACFGPELGYENHPDAVGPMASGRLPTGDLGFWSATEGATTEACAAAQLNARLAGTSDAANTALIASAALVAAANAGPGLPGTGATIDVLTQMNGAAIPSTTFDRATLGLDTSGVWRYEIAFTFIDGGTTHDVTAWLEHVPAADGGYEGLLSWVVDDSFNGGNCGPGPNDVSHNHSLHYLRDANGDLTYQHRQGTFCGHSASGLAAAVTSEVLTGNIVDPTTLWADNFAIFTADFDPANQSGSYAYTWQAGFGDSDSRILFVGLNDHDPVDGEAYYGYGDKVQTATAGDVLGFYCSWAAPGSTHTRHPYAQRQFVSYDAASGLFVLPSAAASNITYAPTNSCLYDGSGTFAYDRDLSGTIDGSDISIVVEDAAPGELEFDLMDTTVGPTTYGSIMETIAGRGFNKPNYP
ncbi:MAG: hypothetical protein ACO3JL_07465, partial [Myxococcota bacterium]